MTTESRIIYISEDNKAFLDKYSCQIHEQEISLKKERELFLSESLLKEFSEILGEDLTDKIAFQAKDNNLLIFYLNNKIPEEFKEKTLEDIQFKTGNGFVEEAYENLPSSWWDSLEKLERVSLVKYGYKINIPYKYFSK